jgi:hypothetical protein
MDVLVTRRGGQRFCGSESEPPGIPVHGVWFRFVGSAYQGAAAEGT